MSLIVKLWKRGGITGCHYHEVGALLSGQDLTGI
jgi:hypothetical protein